MTTDTKNDAAAHSRGGAVRTAHGSHDVPALYFSLGRAYILGITRAREDRQMTDRLTPADRGAIAATMDDCERSGYGDDSTVDQVYFALTFDCGFSRDDAERLAYQAVHGRMDG